MYKMIAVLFIVAGLAISIYAFTAADNFAKDVEEFAQTVVVYKSVWICLLGIVMSVIGVMGVFRDRSAKALARERRPGMSGSRAAIAPEKSGQRAAIKMPEKSGQRPAIKDKPDA